MRRAIIRSAPIASERFRSAWKKPDYWPNSSGPAFKPVSRQRLARVHSPGYIDEIRAYAKSGGGHIEADTIVSPASFEVALLAAGCVCDAAERIVRGEDTQAMCLVRPPGHHAMPGHAMGFCIFNNIAVAARAAVDSLGLDRVLIVDWDVHHGNGTQATFWEDPQVGFLSIHRWPFYPGTGDEDEIGSGPGLGTTLNLPVQYGTLAKRLFDPLLRQPGSVRRPNQTRAGAHKRRFRHP